MQRRVFSTAAAIATLVVPTLVSAQAASNAVADLSGDWFHPVVLSISPADARGTKRFLRYQWVCSARDTREHYEKVGSAGNPGTTSTFK